MYRKLPILFAFLIFFLPATVWAQLPDQTPEKFDTKVWEEYTRKELLELFPNDKALIEKLEISVYNDDIVNAVSYWRFLRIEIYYGLIKNFETEDECDYVLAHEFAHIKLQQPEPVVIDEDGVVILDFELRFEQEREADKIAQDALVSAGLNPCAGYAIAKKTFGDRALANPHNPHSQNNIRRLKLMEEDCRQSMPKIPGKADPRN